MRIKKEFKAGTVIKYAGAAVVGSGLTVAALSLSNDLDVHGMLFDNNNATLIDSVFLNDVDHQGRQFESRDEDGDHGMKAALNEVSFRAGGVYLVYDPDAPMDAQIVMPSERNVGLPDLSSYVQFDAYSDQVADIIHDDLSKMNEYNAFMTKHYKDADNAALYIDDPSAVRIVTLLSNADHDVRDMAGKDHGAIGFKTLAETFGAKVGDFDGNTIYRLDSKSMGFGCTLTFDDTSGNLVGQTCHSAIGAEKEKQILASIGAQPSN